MSDQPTNIVKHNRVYFSAVEAHRILNDLADGVHPYANPKNVLRQVADLFMQIERSSLEEIEREFPTKG